MSLDRAAQSIMLIDDDPENLRVLNNLLSRPGYTVRTFLDGSHALDSAAAEPPDLILLDIRMPEMDGFEVCARLKDDEALRAIPVLFLSAVDDTKEKVRAFEVGGADYITKPFQFEEVLARVKTHLSLQSANSRLEKMNQELERRVEDQTADLLGANRELMKEIESRRSAENALYKSEEKYRRIVTNANEGIISVDGELTVTYANEAVARMVGGTVEDIVGHNGLKFIPAEDHDLVRLRFRERLKGVADQYEGRMIRLDGQLRWVQISSAPILDREGHFEGAVLLFNDITERKQAEINLRQAKDFNQAILKSLPDHIAVLDRNGHILDVNHSWIRFARANGAASNGRIGKGVNYLDVCERSSKVGQVGAQEAIDGIKAVIEGRIEKFELEYDCHSPDEERWFLMTVVPFKGRKGGTIVSHQNITRSKQSEMNLKKALAKIAFLKSQIEADNIYLQEEIKLEHNFGEIIGDSDEIKYTLFRVEQVAKTDSAVIIFGETGTGKELIARAIHNASSRGERPLIKVNCAALPDQFIESELFGHEKGAYTGAVKMRQGKFELAHNGTLFLDEIGELPFRLQGKLLRVLQDGEFERLGDSRTLKTDVRVIAATNRDLQALVEAEKFRKDLWYRLNVFPVTIPPLRDRKEDIPLLANHFVNRFSKKIGKKISTIPKTVLDELMAYDWPGNVRELEHIVERSIIITPGASLRLSEQLISVADEAGPESLKSHACVERDHIVRVLEQTHWIIEGPRGAARVLELHPNTLRYRMKKLDIHRPGQ